ncbi:MAG: hypothetical protein QOF65_2599, partial [Thermoleophilaceae bacterium]|nr:hypothetical protein [Thermoleophilaceae bacterium]
VETVVELCFRDLGESTEVVLTQGAFKTEARWELHRQGWTQLRQAPGCHRIGTTRLDRPTTLIVRARDRPRACTTVKFG